MKSTKCGACGFVGWSDLDHCKACGAPLNRYANNLPPAPTYRNQSFHADGQNKGMAITALVLGIISFFTWGLLGAGAITGIVLGWKAMQRAKSEPWIYGGRGMAIAGFVLSIVSLFSLASMGLVAAIAVPNLLAARRAANEGSAMHSLRTITQAQFVYHENFNKYATLDELAASGLIDSQLATGTKNGYRFTANPTGDENLEDFDAVGMPTTYNSTGRRSFYVDDSAIIRACDNSGAPASKVCPPVDSYPPLINRTTPADYREQPVY